MDSISLTTSAKQLARVSNIHAWKVRVSKRFPCGDRNNQSKVCMKSRHTVRKSSAMFVSTYREIRKLKRCTFYLCISAFSRSFLKTMVEFEKPNSEIWILLNVFKWGSDDPLTRRLDVRQTTQKVCKQYGLISLSLRDVYVQFYAINWCFLRLL